MAPRQQYDDPNANHDHLIIGVVAVFCTLSFTALLMRLESKRIKHVALYWDDYLAIAAWVVAFAQSVVVAYGTHFAGLGRHASFLPVEKVTAFLKAYYALAFLRTTALATAKLSALVLLHRIFIVPGFQITVRVLGLIILLWWLSFTFADAFICSPVRVNWEPTIPHLCGNARIVLLAGPVAWILTDFAILIAPLFVIRTLHLRLIEKIGLCALFLTGGLTCIIACYRYKTLFAPVKDPTWDSVEIGIWSIVEINVTVFCVCIITIKPVLRRLFPATIILQTRLGWSKLRTHGFRGSSKHGLNNVTQSKSTPSARKSFNRLPDVPQFSGFHLSQGQGTQKTLEERSVPLQSVTSSSRSDSLAEMV